MSDSPLDSPIINKRSMAAFGLSAPQLLQAYEEGSLTDPKAIKMAKRISEYMDNEQSRRDKELDDFDKPQAPRWLPWLLWLIPIVTILFVLATNDWKLPF